MASQNNVPRDILDSIRDVLDRRIKLSIKRLVSYEVRREKWENRVLAFSTCRLFVFTARAPSRLDTSFHYLEIQSIESKTPNQLVLGLENKSFTFTTLDSDADEVNHMITHIGTALKTVFPAFPLERLIKKVEVQPTDRLRVMYDMMRQLEKRETGPCGGFTLMYSCMCDYHGLTYRDEVAWDVDTIYLSQDSKELCLRDFDHLMARDLVPIISALIHNPWFTALNANNVKLAPEVCVEILHVMKKNSVIESLLLSNTGINVDFLIKLSTSILSMSATQLQKLDLSDNPLLDDKGLTHIIGSLSSLGKPFTYLDLSSTKLTTKGMGKVAETMSRSSHVFSSLQTLKLADLSSGKAEDLQMLYSFLAQPNMISHLDLSGTDCELDRLVAPLQRGCSQSLSFLKLSRTTFTNKRAKDVVVPPSFKKFFTSVYSLKHVDLSSAKLPPEAVKDLLLGLGVNRNLSGVHLNLSCVDLQSPGAQHLQHCLANLHIVSSLNISNIAFQDTDLSSILNSIGQNKGIRQLAIGDVFQKIKPKNLTNIMEALVHMIQDDDSALESLSLADSRLKGSMNLIINALGSNSSLTEIDISGNQMGDLGARMLSKALQINNRLKAISWDKNNTSAQGFEDIADALDKNYTLKKMPLPVYDASSALKAQPERTEAALKTIESLLQRNHSPQKYSSDQAYRLQQGFLISSTQQMVDRLVVQSQDTINALRIDPVDSYTADINTANSYIADADNSKQLLPKLQDIAIASQNAGNPVQAKLRQISQELKSVLEAQMKSTVHEMLQCTQKRCAALTADQSFMADLQAGCTQKSGFPKDFATNVLDGVDTDIFNKLSELNLAVAAHVSDSILDAVIDRLTLAHKTLTNHLNLKKKNVMNRRTSRPEKADTDHEKSETSGDSPQVQDKRKSILARKQRPQSVIIGSAESSSPRKTTEAIKEVEDFDTVPDLASAAPRLNCVTKDRPKRPKNRPATRQIRSDSVTSDKDVDAFFGAQSRPAPPGGNKPDKGEKLEKADSNSKGTPETKKKTGLFNFGNSKEKLGAGITKLLKKKPVQRTSTVEEQADETPTPENTQEVVTTNESENKITVDKDAEQKNKNTNNNTIHLDSKTEDVIHQEAGNKIKHEDKEKKPLGLPKLRKAVETSPGVKSTESLDIRTNDGIDIEPEITVQGESKSEDTVTIEEAATGKDEETVEVTGEEEPVKEEDKEEDKEPDKKQPAVTDTKDDTTEDPKPALDQTEPTQNETKPPAELAESPGPQVEGPGQEEEEVAAPKPKKPQGLGFGVDIMAQLKQKQEKRKSMMPSASKLPEKSPDEKEKTVPFGLKHLKPVVTDKKPETTTSETSENKTTDIPKATTSRQSLEKEMKINETTKVTPTHVAVAKEKNSTSNGNPDSAPRPPGRTRRGTLPDKLPEEAEKPSPFGMKNLKPVFPTKKPESKTPETSENKTSDITKVAPTRKSLDKEVKTDEKANVTSSHQVVTKENKEKKASEPAQGQSKVKVTKDNESSKVTPSHTAVVKENKEGAKVTPTDKSEVREEKANEITKVPSTHQTAVKEEKSTSHGQPDGSPRPSVSPRPHPQTRPRPPPTANKPKPAPRKSLSTAEEAEMAGKLELSPPNTDNIREETGVVSTESDSSKLSVKDRISMFRKSEGDEGAVEKMKQYFAKDSKGGSLPRDIKPSDIHDIASQDKDRFSLEKRKSGSPELGNADIRMETNKEMTDSGIGDDTDAIKRDGRSRFSVPLFDTGPKKSDSLPRDGRATDLLKEMDGTPKRPKSMLALVKQQQEGDSSPVNKPATVSKDKEGQTEKLSDKSEAEDKHSPTEEEEGVLV